MGKLRGRQRYAPRLPGTGPRLVSRCATIRMPMRLVHLSLTNFRNYTRLEIEFPVGPTLLVGANAQGKTSLLEAIYFLTSAASPHASSDRQLVNFLALRQTPAFARLAAEVESHGQPRRIEIRLLLEPQNAMGEGRLRKEVLLNGVKRRVADLSGVFTAVMFLPQDMRVIEGAPSERRRQMDALLSQADPTYAATLSEYGKVLSQRNALLKQAQERGADNGQMAFWDEHLADKAAYLIRARALALTEIEGLAVPIHHELTRGVETLRLEYQPAYNPQASSQGQLDLPIEASIDWSGVDISSLRHGMLDALARSRLEEIARGMTLIGPHRDDVRYLANAIDLRLYGSRGQNRTAMLATKLAEVRWLQQRTGEDPVLLLDEVLAELDLDRRRDLLERLGDAHQAILTAADLTMFLEPFRGQAAIWQVEAGTVRPWEAEGEA